MCGISIKGFTHIKTVDDLNIDAVVFHYRDTLWNTIRVVFSSTQKRIYVIVNGDRLDREDYTCTGMENNKDNMWNWYNGTVEIHCLVNNTIMGILIWFTLKLLMIVGCASSVYLLYRMIHWLIYMV